MWPNNYGVWVDEFQSLDLEDCLYKTWPMTIIFLGDQRTKYLDRPYGRVNRKDLKRKLIEKSVLNGVKFFESKVWIIEHREFELVVDARGFRSPFVKFNEPRNHGYQIVHGILDEVDEHPFDLDKMVLMDWRDDHLGNEPHPTFLYAMSFDSNLIFLEETSLVSRPVLPYNEVKKRMVARIRHLGIKVKRVIEGEKCLIPMGGPLPTIPQSILRHGATAGLVHPSTGYMVVQTLARSTQLADVIAEYLGSTRMIRGSQMHQRVWNGLWPMDKRCSREYYRFGMETLLKLDLKGTRKFFHAFFNLYPYYWQGFLSSRLDIMELGMLSLFLFNHASNNTRIDIVTKYPLPLVKMIGKLVTTAI
ncbi:hypothetical protein MKX01_012700 [Papaver californicum]|nr:hypothetical protein MKX01_012700 [Papaver californicum]